MSRRPAKKAMPEKRASAANAETLRQDDYASAVLGARALMSQRSGMAGLSDMMRYAKGGLFSRVVDMPADKAVDRGVIIKGDAKGEVGNEFDRLGVIPLLADCLRWSQVTGGAAIVVMASDGGTLKDELSESALSEIVELRVFPGTDFSAEPERYNDESSVKFGHPIRYRVSTNGFSFVVHESRIIPVSGGPMPSGANLTNIPWMGRPEVSRGYKAICRYETALDYSENILQRKQQAVYSMKGMADLIKNPAFGGDPRAGERIVQARIGAVDSVRGVLTTVAVDADDAYTVIDNNLGGVKDTIGEMKSAVCAEFGIPVTLLFEESPGGMNSTGESDFKGWHEKVKGMQTRLHKPLERLVSLIMLQTSVSAFPDWKVEFPPVESPSETQVAEVENKRAATRKLEVESLKTAVDASILTEQQAAEQAKKLGLYDIQGLDTGAGAGRGAAVDYAEQT